MYQTKNIQDSRKILARSKLYLENIDLLKVNNRNTKEKCEICSKLTIKTSDQRPWCRSGVFIVNFEHMCDI